MNRPTVPDILTSKAIIFKCSDYRTNLKTVLEKKYQNHCTPEAVTDLFRNYPAWLHVAMMDACDRHSPDYGLCPFYCKPRDTYRIGSFRLCGIPNIEELFWLDENMDFISWGYHKKTSEVKTYLGWERKYEFVKGGSTFTLSDASLDWKFSSDHGEPLSYEEYENKWEIKLSTEINDDAAFMDAVRYAVEQVGAYINEAYVNDPLKRVLKVSVEDDKEHEKFSEKSETDMCGAYFEKTKGIVLYRNVIKSCIAQLGLEDLVWQMIAMVLVHEIEHARQDLTLYESFYSLHSLAAEPESKRIYRAIECFAEGAAYRYLDSIKCQDLIDKWMAIRKQTPSSPYTVFDKVYYWETDEKSWRSLLAEYEDKYVSKATFVYEDEENSGCLK